MGAESKDGRSARCLVAANALEDTRAIVHDVTHHMDGRVFPVHELTVAPNTVVVIYRHCARLPSKRSFKIPSERPICLVLQLRI